MTCDTQWHTQVAGNIPRQKAPSAKRCIKTDVVIESLEAGHTESESTERQKVH